MEKKQNKNTLEEKGSQICSRRNFHIFARVRCCCIFKILLQISRRRISLSRMTFLNNTRNFLLLLATIIV
jgi:hypothetical protein